MYIEEYGARGGGDESDMKTRVPRQPEPETMDLPEEVAAYAHADFAEANQAFAERLVSLGGGLEKPRCVDLGTGPADIPIRVARMRPQWRITAVDTSPPMLGFARHAVDQAGLTGTIELMLTDAKSTGLKGKTFDVIFANSILHHINDTLRLWGEVKRLGRKGTLVFLRDLTRPDGMEAARQIVTRYAAEESDLLQREYLRSLMAAYTPEEVRGQLEAAGLSHLKVEQASDRHMDIFGRLT